MVYTVLLIISIPITIFGIYYFITGIFGFLKIHKSPINSHDSKHKFAILIAARNEETVIESLIHSLKSQNYPDELYDIFVIPNNCNDNTRAVAKEAGATILNCTIPTKNKGEVLRYVFKKLKKNKSIDAYVFFDADNIVHENFLKRMNDALCEGYEIVQGNRDSKNPHDSWISGAMSITYWMLNVFYNKARANLKGSALINGTGFMIKKSFIDEFGYETTSITEDLEYSVQCMLKDKKVMFLEDAYTYDEQPIKFKQSLAQKSRWTAGEVQCLKKYSKTVLKSFFKTRKLVLLDIWFRLLAPIYQIASVIFSIVSAIIVINSVSSEQKGLVLLYYGITLLVSYLATVLFSIFNTVYYKQLKSGKIVLAAFLLPFLILTWVPIVIKNLFKADHKWIEIKHTRNIKIHEI